MTAFAVGAACTASAAFALMLHFHNLRLLLHFLMLKKTRKKIKIAGIIAVKTVSLAIAAPP